MTNPLPRLAVIGENPVERSFAGALLLYRLLGDYPPDRLLVVQGSHPTPAAALPGVAYHVVRPLLSRFRRTRLSKYVNLVLTQLVRTQLSHVRRYCDPFAPDAVLAVATGWLWPAAAIYARRREIPLHLIIHDDWPMNLPLPGWARGYQDYLFRAAYRAAASRLCVSDGMAEEYAQRFGVPGVVLLPTRGEESPKAMVRVRPASTPLVVAYAGSLWTTGAVPMLRDVAEQLAVGVGGRLDVYAPGTGEGGEMPVSLRMSNIRRGGFLPQTELADRIGAEADVLFLPVPFEPEVRPMATLSFPSKLADYTAIGLPILIWGPEDSSAVQWAAGRPGVAEVVTNRDPAQLRIALERLASDPVHRRDLASRAVEAGTSDFSLTAGRAILHGALRRGAN